jgi:flagellar motor switch protein FliM
VKPVREFLAERAAAQHCAQLVQRGPSPAELLPMLTRAGERLARLLGGRARATDGPRHCGTSGRPGRTDDHRGPDRPDRPTGANSCCAGPPDAPLLLSIDAGAVLRMVDRAFGGKGEIPADMPASFPLSAELLIARLEGLVAAQIAAVLNCAAPPERCAAMARWPRLNPLPPHCPGPP